VQRLQEHTLRQVRPVIHKWIMIFIHSAVASVLGHELCNACNNTPCVRCAQQFLGATCYMWVQSPFRWHESPQWNIWCRVSVTAVRNFNFTHMLSISLSSAHLSTHAAPAPAAPSLEQGSLETCRACSPTSSQCSPLRQCALAQCATTLAGA
jgi:hypothetical protein